MATFIPPANGASQSKNNFETWLFAKDVLKNFSPFCLASPEKFGVEFGKRQMDKFFDTIYGCIAIFLSVKFATSLLVSLAGG